VADETIRLQLSRAQALVFFDWLARFNDAGDAELEDQAEQRVLWNLEAMLEAALVEVLDPEYDRLLAEARATVRDPIE
jgi:hypothetical protein